MRTDLAPAYVIHSRHYRNTSLLVDFFCQEQGRVTCVAKGVRRNNRQASLQPFQPLLVSWVGKSELKTLTGFERDSAAAAWQSGLAGETLVCGLYLNELMMRVLEPFDPHPTIYMAYQQALEGLTTSIEISLRVFELQLLEAIGYGFDFTPLQAEAGSRLTEHFDFDSQLGFVPAHAPAGWRKDCLLAIEKRDFSDLAVRRVAKQLTRLALAPHLGDKPLYSRQLLFAGVTP